MIAAFERRARSELVAPCANPLGGGPRKLPALVPDGDEPRLAVVVEEVGVRRVEPADVDDSYKDSRPSLMFGGFRNRLRSGLLVRLDAFDSWTVQGQWICRMNEADRGVVAQTVEHGDRGAVAQSTFPLSNGLHRNPALSLSALDLPFYSLHTCVQGLFPRLARPERIRCTR